MNEVINTGLFYFVLCGIAIVAIALPVASRLPGCYNVRPDLASESATLVLIVAAALAVNLAFSAFSDALEAVQRFDVINHAYIVTLAARSIASMCGSRMDTDSSRSVGSPSRPRSSSAHGTWPASTDCCRRSGMVARAQRVLLNESYWPRFHLEGRNA